MSAIDESKVDVRIDMKKRPGVVVTIPDDANPFLLNLYFAHAGQHPPFLGYEVLALDESAALEDERSLDEPALFARLARWLPMYIDYARAEIEWKGGDADRALETLRREAGKNRRGLPPRFYREVAREYKQLVQEGNPHPIKTIAERRPVHKSRASRWIKEARARGYISGKETTDAS